MAALPGCALRLAMKPLLWAMVSLLFTFSPASAGERTIEFGGLTWNVRQGTKLGPGPNNWSDDKQSVWVDDQGRLHLKLRRDGGTWYCAEVSSQKSLGYGEYVFQVATNVERFDPNVVAGLFTYLDDDHEIDFEFSRWGKSKNRKAQYVVQPGSRSQNIHRFDLGLTGDYSTHRFSWSKGSVAFQSEHGHTEGLPSREKVIQKWACMSKDVPKASREKVHINLWLFQGKAPADGREVELIVAAFRFDAAKG
jgi:hypothetical protein